MPQTFAFLRAINVGGHTVTMARLKALFEDLGFDPVETFIASGNVVFGGGQQGEASLRSRIETHLRRDLGYEVCTFLRSEGELATLVQNCPFNTTELATSQALNLALLHEPLSEADRTRLRALETGVDDLRAVGREIWWSCRMKQSKSTFSNAILEKSLGLKATFRGYNTLKRMAEKYLPK